MNDTLTVPKTLKVGFQERGDTYTGKLAYVIYIDDKGKVRKEGSWESWRDKKIDPLELPNEPRSGFVLNKDVGGTRHSYGWNARMEKVRVYDPRDFEFEISIPNLLFILQECSAIKGKGLEGDFVYAWSGTELVLLPTSCQEYTGSVAFNALQKEKVTKTDMVVGCSYLTKKKEEVVYMGQYVWWGTPNRYHWNRGNPRGRKKHIFAKLVSDSKYDKDDNYLLDDGFTKLAKRTSTSPIPQYPEIHAALVKSSVIAQPVRLYTEPCSHKTDDRYWYTDVAIEHNGVFYLGRLDNEYTHTHTYYWDRKQTGKFIVNCHSILSVTKGEIKTNDVGVFYHIPAMTIDEARQICKSLWVECENGSKQELLSCKI